MECHLFKHISKHKWHIGLKWHWVRKSWQSQYLDNIYSVILYFSFTTFQEKYVALLFFSYYCYICICSLVWKVNHDPCQLLDNDLKSTWLPRACMPCNVTTTWLYHVATFSKIPFSKRVKYAATLTSLWMWIINRRSNSWQQVVSQRKNENNVFLFKWQKTESCDIAANDALLKQIMPHLAMKNALCNR